MFAARLRGSGDVRHAETLRSLRDRTRWSSALIALALCGWLAIGSLTALAAREPALPPIYDHWLHAEVNYLITDEERQLFFGLKTNAERDRFMDSFWQARNPDRLSPINRAKETHYQRLAYANSHFSRGNSEDGWRSDRGMVYITLGAPAQIEKHVETGELKPIEIWFYQNLSGALPTHFYVLFYKQSAAEDYELYSPYGDRPQKLINSTNAINDDRTAIRLIQRDLNDEAAHVALSLIPGEPVDFKSPQPTLESDVLLNNIRNYRNLPQIREMLDARLSAAESVSHRMILGEQTSELAAIATRDPGRQASIHYLLRLLRAEDFSLAAQDGGSYYYSLQMETRLTDAAGKVIVARDQPLAGTVTAKDFGELRSKCFGVEGRIPAPPGSYQLSVTLTNLVTKQAFRQSRAVVVPGLGDRIGVSQVFFAAPGQPRRGSSVDEPFSFSGVHLEPIGGDHMQVTQGTALREIFQLWASPGDPAALRGRQLQVHYLIGRLDTQARQEEDQSVDRGSFTSDGNLLLGKDLRTDTLTPAIYRMVVKVTDPESAATAYQSLNFEVLDKAQPVHGLWTVELPNAAE